MQISDWIGRSESRIDIVTAAPVAALSATLDRDDRPPAKGDPLPLLWHWLYFLPRQRASALDADGHARRGDFLPPVTLPRRMYAGGRLDVLHPLRVGDRIERVSRILDVQQKDGRTGPLVFVTVRHEISDRDGRALIEEHDIVYRGHPTARDQATAPGLSARAPADARGASSAPPGARSDAAWEREIRPDEVLLFRYSALTFNAYRIHYDRRFAAEVHGYPGLVVHAPLIATLLADLLRRHLPDTRVSQFSFRAVRPLFDGDPVLVCGRPAEDGRSVELWARGADGAIVMEARAACG